MPKAKLIRKFLLVLLIISLPAVCRIPRTEAQEEEKRPQIDVEDYNVDAELFPGSNQIKVKSNGQVQGKRGRCQLRHS